MALTVNEAFKAGFLLRCSEEGLTIDQIETRAKMAFALLDKRAQMSAQRRRPRPPTATTWHNPTTYGDTAELSAGPVGQGIKQASPLITGTGAGISRLGSSIAPLLGAGVLGLGSRAADVVGASIKTAPSALGYLLLLGGALPIAGGAIAGHLAAKSKMTSRDDIADIQHQNLLAEYYRLSEDARRRNKVIEMREKASEDGNVVSY